MELSFNFQICLGFCLLIFLTLVKSESVCSAAQKSQESYLKWTNSLPILIKQDKAAAKLWKKRSNVDEEDFDSIREKFYEMTSQTFENQCMVIKKFGGMWSSSAKIIDGQKPVCLDKMYQDIQSGKCLVYSFGVGDDFTFETAMAGLGCTVRAFDLYVDTKDKSFVTDPNITFSYVGLSHVRGKIELAEGGARQMLTLKDAIAEMGDEGKKISYLKVDVEGSEILSISNWIIDGLPKIIDQIAIEFHTGKQMIKKRDVVSTLTELVDDLQDLFKIGFRTISYEANLFMGKSQDFTEKYYTYFDVVMYKK